MEKKKMSIKKRVLLGMAFLILILIILFVFHGARNLIIIRKLQSNFSQYADSTNYKETTISKGADGVTTTLIYYKKDNKGLRIFQKNDADSEDYAKMSLYYNGERIDMFTETNEEKIATLNTGSSSLFNSKLANGLEEGTIDFNAFILLTKIRKIEIDGKEGYHIKNYFGAGFLYAEDDEMELFYEEDTGLLMKQIFSETTVEKEYEFGNVDDSVFIEPNIGEYSLSIAENND